MSGRRRGPPNRGCTYCDIVIDADWPTAVLTPGLAVLNGAFIVRIAERDDQGRPVVARGLRSITDVGTPTLISWPLSADWNTGDPIVTWEPLTNPNYRPAE